MRTALSRLLWLTLGVFTLWMAASALSDALLTGRAWLPVTSLLLGVLVVLSGVLLLDEWRRNPLSETERGEWTGPMLAYSLVFAITFFVFGYSFLGWYFS
ncbi:Hypothetical Protein RradSPS_1431 [Rubrobacter radiotolerans]|uniref:Uncharacterized protein n=1 Tax=Rubrobacter radiotolerans TaxID=42256 RepID=A0A023X3T7_RUBRA|nr:hypothetical protein [Rubrobacter radiotolerans]AHY46714.1 Hypothetical Protein RradSPS_1431 [Rubrobacter radiotolerans]MDX5894121.1 hypothetical protein [Rubrobacter radiotolerans]SMC05257.1 hypothetical protein SAMN00767673_1431 [Rubrobacter radiotolerans DSM 5868]